MLNVGAPNYYLANFFSENWMKMNGIRPRGEARVTGAALGSANAQRGSNEKNELEFSP